MTWKEYLNRDHRILGGAFLAACLILVLLRPPWAQPAKPYLKDAKEVAKLPSTVRLLLMGDVMLGE